MASSNFNFPGVFPSITDLSQVVTANSTTSCAYVGEAEFGPINKPTLVTNLRGYTDTFGKLSPTYGYMGYSLAVAADSINQHYVVRVVDEETARYAAAKVFVNGVENPEALKEGFTHQEILAAQEDSGALFLHTDDQGVTTTDTKSAFIVTAANPNNKQYKVLVEDSTINENKNFRSVSVDSNITTGDVYVTVPETGIFEKDDSITISAAEDTAFNGRFKVKEIAKSYEMSVSVQVAGSGYAKNDKVMLTGLTLSDGTPVYATVTAVNPQKGVIGLVLDKAVDLKEQAAGQYKTSKVSGEGDDKLEVMLSSTSSENVVIYVVDTEVATKVFLGSVAAGGQGGNYVVGEQVSLNGITLSNGSPLYAIVKKVEGENNHVTEIELVTTEDTKTIEGGEYATTSVTGNGVGLKIKLDVALDTPSSVRIQKYPSADETTFSIKVYETVGKVTTLIERYNYLTLFDNKDNYGNSTFVEDVINGRSKTIQVFANPNVKTEENPYPVPSASFTIVDGQQVEGIIPLEFGTSGDSVMKKNPSKLNSGWELFNDRSQTYVTLLMNSGYISDSYQNAMLATAEKRRDCFCLFDAPMTSTAADQVLDWRKNEQGFNTYRGAVFSPWVKTFDSVQGKNNFLMAPTAYIAKIIGASGYPWIAAAGPNRGGLASSVVTPTGLTNYYDETIGGTLYSNQINCIIKDTTGYANWGQKTLQQKPSALDRINVARTVIYIETTLRDAARYHLFENNTPFERMQVTLQFNQFLDTVLNADGIQRYQVVCDGSNNTPYVIAQNQLIIDIYLWPTYTTEFIALNTVVMGPDAEITITTNS